MIVKQLNSRLMDQGLQGIVLLMIDNKVLYYPDFNSKLKVIKGKISTKNIIPDMGHGRPIDFSPIRTYLCQLLRAIFIALIIEFQDNIADMVRYVF